MQKTKIAKINKHFADSSKLIKSSLSRLRRPIIQTAELIVQTFSEGNKLLICGNGGSAAEAQHFSSDLVGRYVKERRAVPAIALSADSSTITAIGNDYGIERVFSRQVEAHAKKGDVLMCISTSGNSPNVIAAAKTAKAMHVKVICLTGHNGGKLKSHCDISFIIPSNITAYIQEVHLIVIHAICDLVESAIH